MRRAKFLSRPILFKSGWNWNLKFEFFKHYGQKTIFQTKWTKNADEPKIYLVWFSSAVWRGQFPLKFPFTWALLYLRAVLRCFRLCLRDFNLFLFYSNIRAFGWRSTDRNWICSSQTNKKVQLCFFQNILSATILCHRKRDI